MDLILKGRWACDFAVDSESPHMHIFIAIYFYYYLKYCSIFIK